MEYKKIYERFISEMENSQDDTITLYHYTHSRNLSNGGTLKPGCTPNSWSRNEFQKCQVPRIFFYTEMKPERMLAGNTVLLSTVVNKKDIYHLVKDKGVPYEKDEPINSWLENIKNHGYKGAMYNVGFEVVIWFEPIEVSPH
jgi:hypothetical protein